MIEAHPTEEMALVVTAKLTHSPRYAQSTMHMKYEPCYVSDEAGNELGFIAPCVGGGIELSDEATGETWTLDYDTLWAAFQRALGRS